MRTVVANQGGADAPPFRIGFYYSNAPTFTSSAIYAGWFCNVTAGLAVGKVYTCAGQIGVPNTLAPGTWYVFAVADDQNAVPQDDRAGNVRVSEGGSTTISAP